MTIGADLDATLENLQAEVGAIQQQMAALPPPTAPMPAFDPTAINQQLALAERKLTNEQGLPRRPWMKHLLYAPGWYTGYSAKTMPGVREAIEEGRYAEAEEQVVLVARALQDEALNAWHGKNENLRAGQRAFYHRAKCDSAAALGRYPPSMEVESAAA